MSRPCPDALGMPDGICFGYVAPLRQGSVRDLRNDDLVGDQLGTSELRIGRQLPIRLGIQSRHGMRFPTPARDTLASEPPRASRSKQFTASRSEQIPNPTTRQSTAVQAFDVYNPKKETIDAQGKRVNSTRSLAPAVDTAWDCGLAGTC